MKELYISPELNVLCFAPMERLASSVNAVELLGASPEPEVTSQDGDLGLDLDLF